MQFVADGRFASLTEAFAFVLDRYTLRVGPERHWLKQETGLLVPRDMPPFLFRGECGDFSETTSTVGRPSTYEYNDGEKLLPKDQRVLLQLIPALAKRFVEQDYEPDEHAAYGLLQHYGMPTPMIDFTGNLSVAFAFAAAGKKNIGRVAALPLNIAKSGGLVIDLHDHKWAERAQRQAAFAFVPAVNFLDLKSPAARAQLQLQWFEFPITEADRAHLANQQQKLVNISDDPSAGFLRFHLTEYVEASGKFSPELTEWLLERIPIVPRCYRLNQFDKTDVVVNCRGADALPHFDPAIETAYSRRYWSPASPDHSFDRMAARTWPNVGSITADPRTYHQDRYSDHCELATFTATRRPSRAEPMVTTQSRRKGNLRLLLQPTVDRFRRVD